MIRNTVDPGLYGGQYRIIASRVYDYIDKYKAPPKDHLADILIDKLDGENKRENNLYADILTSMRDGYSGLNAEYVINQLDTFIKRQSLRTVAVDLAKLLQRDTEESLIEAETLIRQSQQQGMSLFDPGLRLSDKKRALNFLERHEHCFPTGIPEFDKRGFGPTRKELLLLIADTKKGKSWWLIQLAKMALMSRLKVLHITLENDEDVTSKRYFQTFFAVTKRNEPFSITKFQKDNLGRITGFDQKRITPKLSFDDPNIRRKLEKKIDKTRAFNNIIIKQFPTSQLTVPQLSAFMDNLEQTERFVPDLLVLDYPDLMKLDLANYRISIGGIYKEVRGLLVTRNIAGAIVSQSNREGGKAKSVGREHTAEAYSKLADVDTAITYSQTDAEKQLGLARLNVIAGRNDQDGIGVVVSQHYGIGGFAVDSTLMVGNYWGNVPRAGQGGDDE